MALLPILAASLLLPTVPSKSSSTAHKNPSSPDLQQIPFWTIQKYNLIPALYSRIQMLMFIENRGFSIYAPNDAHCVYFSKFAKNDFFVENLNEKLLRLALFNADYDAQNSMCRKWMNAYPGEGKFDKPLDLSEHAISKFLLRFIVIRI